MLKCCQQILFRIICLLESTSILVINNYNNSCSTRNIFYDSSNCNNNNVNGYRHCATSSFTIFLWEDCLQCRWEQKVCYWLMSFIRYSSGARMWFSIKIITYKTILRSWSSESLIFLYSMIFYYCGFLLLFHQIYEVKKE